MKTLRTRRCRSWITLPATTWLALSCGLAVGAEGALQVEIAARSVAPGEPLRVIARSSEPLAALGGEFLGQSVFFVRAAQDGPRERWEGWTSVALDRRPGPAPFELEGRAVRGGRVGATLLLAVEAREFPEERLQVASRFVKPPAEVSKRLARERKKLAAVYRTRSATLPAGVPFLAPVDGEPTGVFGTRRFFNDQPRSPHPGLDLRAAEGTPVAASGAGEVVLAEDLYYSGNTVILDHGGGLFTLYAHLSKIVVGEGEVIVRGQLIGHSGSTGRVTGPHLHWGAKIGRLPFDPRALQAPELFP